MQREQLMKEAEKWIVITDMDGTIIDSEAANFRVLLQMLDEFGIANHRSTVLRIVGEGIELEEAMKMIHVTPEVKMKMENRMKSLLSQTPVPLLPGVLANIRALKDMGLLFCIATDNYSQIITQVIREHDLGDVFEPEFIVASDTFPKRKPSPDIVDELVKRSGRKKVIVLGNTPKEVAMARDAGYPAVIITDGREVESKTAKKKGTFMYEWGAFGGICGKDIFPVKDWEEVKNVIIEIIQSNGVEE